MRKIIFIILPIVFIACQPEGVQKDNVNPNDEAHQDTIENRVGVKDSSLNNTVTEESLTPKDSILQSGVKIHWKRRGNGASVGENDAVRINFTGVAVKSGKVFDSNAKAGVPIPLMLGYSMVPKGWDEAMTYLKVGDEVTIEVPAKQAYGKDGDGMRIPPNSDLKIEMEVVSKIYPVSVEGVKIYHLTKELDTTKIFKEGDEVSFHYLGYTPRGVFFTSYKDKQPFAFELGTKNIMKGLNIAFKNVMIGEKAFITIPSELAYGKDGLVDMVKPNEPVMYYINSVSKKQ